MVGGHTAAEARRTTEAVPPQLRQIRLVAGGWHDDWDEYDPVILADQRPAMPPEFS